MRFHIRCIIPNMENFTLAYALYLLRQGVLSLDEEGRLWRHSVLTHGKWVSVEARRAENVGGKGYLRLTLQIEGRLRSVMVHRVIWEWLKGPIPVGVQINHIDLNKQNNRISNLELLSGSGNIRHSYRNGRPHPWHKASVWRGKPRLTDVQKQEIKDLRATGMLLKDIGARFNIGTTHVSRICSEEGGERES